MFIVFIWPFKSWNVVKLEPRLDEDLEAIKITTRRFIKLVVLKKASEAQMLGYNFLLGLMRSIHKSLVHNLCKGPSLVT